MKKLFTIAIMALSINTFAQIPTNGLVGYWPFNGNANDESGNSNNGTVNGATLTTDRFGNENSAYNFNGTNNWIETNNTIGNFELSNFTISCWINSSGGSFEETYIGKRSAGTWGSYWYGDINPTSRQSSYVLDESGNVIYEGLYSKSLVDESRWYNIVFTRDGTNLNLYVNGVADTSMSTTYIQNLSNTAPMTIGARYYNSTPIGFFTGQIDDIRIYDRALSGSEVTTLFNEGLCFETIIVTDTLIINVSLTGFSPVTYANTIKVYPNPTSDKITIDCGNNYSTLNGYTIKIANSIGQLVYTSLVNQQTTTIDLNSWTGKGIYFVHLIDGRNNTIDIKKIVLQ
jgi:hypothetical protein